MDISSLLEVEVKEGKASELPNNGEIEAYANIPDFSLRDIASVRFRKLHCTACDVHIGSAPSSAHNMHEHPVLHVLLCTACRNFYGDGTFEQGDDATDMFCRWCANGGNLYCCSYCSNTFCYNCIRRNFDAVVRKKIERDEKWKCFVCNPADLYTARAACWALLQHVQTVTRILQSDRKMSPKEIEAKMNLDESQCCPHRNKRKRSETVGSEEDDQEETYNASQRKKRRRYPGSRRKRRVIKMENDGSCDSGSLESTNNSRTGMDDGYLMEGPRENEDFVNDQGERVTPEEMPLAVRQQRSRRLHAESRILPKFPINDDDIPASLLQPDQTMVEGAESLSFPNTSASLTIGTSEQPRNTGISAVPMVNLMKRPLPPTGPLMRGGKTHRLVRGAGGTSVLVRKIAPATNHNVNSNVQSLPMVTIPSMNHMGNRVSVIQTTTTNSQESINSSNMRPIRPRPLVPKPLSVTLPASSNSTGPNFSSAPPSVIDLDSDGDDPIVILGDAPQQILPTDYPTNEERVCNLSTVTYPVRPDDGLMMIHSASPRDQNENGEGKTFAEIIRKPYSIDSVLDSFKSEFNKVMESTIPEPMEGNAVRNHVKKASRTIQRSIVELQNLKERLIRAYRNHKCDGTNTNVVRTKRLVLERRQKTREFTPLDMECTRESEPESEDSAISDDEEPSTDLSESPLRIIEPRQRSVHRAVDATPRTKSQSVQAYDVESRDCESGIGYALLLKADYDPKRECDILRPVAVPDENFGKYEEQFINYLQHIEDHGIETEESRLFGPTKDTDVSVNQLVEADLSAIIDQITSERSTDYGVTKENMMEENVEILEEHLEIFTTKSDASEDSNLSSETRDKLDAKNNSSRYEETPLNNEKETEIISDRRIFPLGNASCSTNGDKENDSSSTIPREIESVSTTIESDINLEKMDSKRIDEETVLAVRALIDEDDKKTDISNPWKPIDSDDECMILD